MEKAELKILAAKRRVMKAIPFLGSIFYQTPSYLDDGKIFRGIACTNGLWHKFNRNYVDACDVAELAFVGAHECAHIAFRSFLREKGRKHHLWNKACDYAINLMLDEVASNSSYSDSSNKPLLKIPRRDAFGEPHQNTA